MVATTAATATAAKNTVAVVLVALEGIGAAVAVGDTEGRSEGTLEGKLVLGDSDGDADGSVLLGMEVVGVPEGTCDCDRVGSGDGGSEGTNDGENVGSMEGCSDGTMEGGGSDGELVLDD